MVSQHAEDRFNEPDWYFGKQSTDITRRYGKQIPSHSYNPEILRAPVPYHVIPYHDMSDKFRNKMMRDRRKQPKEDYYYGRMVTEISSPTKFPEIAADAAFLPWPESSQSIGDSNFSRWEYLHPLGRTRPGPMDDFVPVLRDKKTGKVIGNPPPPPSRKHSRRRMLGLHPDGCHSPGSPCMSRSPSPGGAGDDDDEAPRDDDAGFHPKNRYPRPHDEYHPPATQGFSSLPVKPPTPPKSACCDDPPREYDNERPYTAPAAPRPNPNYTDGPELQKPRARKKSYISSYGANTLHVQPVGGRPQRTHADEMEEKMYGGAEEPQSPASYISYNPGETPRVRYSLGSNSQRAQPLGGRASIINAQELEMARQTSPQSEYSDATTSYQTKNDRQTPRGRAYPPQHPSFSMQPSQRDKDDEAFAQYKHRSNGDDRSTGSSQSSSSRKASIPPKYNPSLPPEGERGRAHRKSSGGGGSGRGGGVHCQYHGLSPCPAQSGAACRAGRTTPPNS